MGLKVIVSVILMGLNACYLVGKRMSFESRFHKILALDKENSTLHIPQKNNDREGQGSIGVESGMCRFRGSGGLSGLKVVH